MPHQIRRIGKELENIDYSLDVNEKSVEFLYKKYQAKFFFRENYPFLPPLLMIDNKPISYNPSLFPTRLYQQYKELHVCPCCESITCPNNWTPAMGMLRILREYLDFVETLKNYQKKRIFQPNNLPDDVIKEIISFIM